MIKSSHLKRLEKQYEDACKNERLAQITTNPVHMRGFWGDQVGRLACKLENQYIAEGLC